MTLYASTDSRRLVEFPTKAGVARMQQRWLVSWDDGDGVAEEVFSGKLSLEPMWVMVIDANRSPQVVVFATPTYRVVEIREAV